MRFAWFAIALLGFVAAPVRARAEVDYLKEIKPLLRERCYACHGGLKQKKNLRVDTVAGMLKGGSDGAALVPGKPEESLIWQRVTATDPEERMPPEHEGQPFTVEQVKLLSDWIAAGAPAPTDEKGEADPKDHWAFRECVKPRLPSVANSEWVRNPIDHFIAEGHRAHGLTPQPEAPRAILLRRLYMDLIGLPPSAEDMATAMDSKEGWYAATVNRLLEDPRHGERWARHWMDVWRYSDWFGLGDQLRNSQLHIWHWRDWIVESLNADVPYDEMVRLMLAADELHPDDQNKLRATGFLARNYYLFNRNQWMDEVVEHVSKGLLGLTINCAKCHDHKYDPIRQTEYYQMRAFFEPYHARIDVMPGEPDLAKNGIPCAFDAQTDTPTYLFVRGQENQPDKSAVMPARPPQFLEFAQFTVQPVALPITAYEPERRPWVLDAYLQAARQREAEAERAVLGARKNLAEALRREADSLESQNSGNTTSTNNPALAREKAKLAVDETRAGLSVAEARHALANAELRSVERKAEAMRAAWDGTAERTNAATAAIRAEREVARAKAQLALAEAEQRLAGAAADKKEAVGKEIASAREALTKANQTAQAAIRAEDKYAPLAGAKWTPTRFLNSTADDPQVAFAARSTGRRKALAEWITDRRNPLTARVAVNHIWARHFGTPLVATTFDLGRKNGTPAHRELLDWLAAEFMESGWSMKHLHRLIVTSATYRMSSSLAGSPANAANDSDNVFLWRRNPIRLEAEVVRDTMLALAGKLDCTRGGPSVPPDQQEKSNRRSLYFFHSHNDRNLFLTTFDGAGVKECYRRDQSIVPQQALALTNSKLAFEAADAIAEQIGSSLEDDAGIVRRAMSLMLGIEPSEAEVAASVKALDAWRKLAPANDAEPTNARARLVWALLNHNDFVTQR